MIGTARNDFAEDLKWSESESSQDWWSPYYYRAFPRLERISMVKGPSAAQKAGIDKIVTLEGGKNIFVDEKIRRNRAPDDILIEFEHVPASGSSWLGWITKANQFTDYIAFGFALYRIAFFFPFIPLQNAWENNAERWIERFGTCKARNPKNETQELKYWTLSCPVPTEILMGHMLGAMRITV